MLELVDEALEALLRAEVPLSAQDVDVAFEAPEEDWSAKLNRPTVNLYLWDIRRSSTRAVAGTEVVQQDGVLVRRMALPRVELRYLVTVWTSDHGDERALLGGLLRAALAFGEIPSIYVPEGLAHLPPIHLAMARSDESRSDMRTLDDRFKTGLNLIVTTVVDTKVGRPAGPPVTGLDLRVLDRNTGASDHPPRRIAGEVADPAAVGVAVTTPRGSGSVNAAGRFLVPGVEGDEVVLHTEPPRTAVVPAEGGIVFP